MTSAERAWCDVITQIGCIACIVSTGIFGTPGAVHHLKEGGRRVRRRGGLVDHQQTICLCDPGHHQNPPAGSNKIPRHPFKQRFERAYGTEEQLLEFTRRLVTQRAARMVA